MSTPRLDAVGVYTVGRLGFSNTFGCIEDTHRVFGLDHSKVVGGLWEQSITRAIDWALSKNTEYLLFYDGDGIWLPQQVADLYGVIDHDRTIDAVVPVQADRNGIKPLAHGWMNSEQVTNIKYDYSKPITPIIHGHFGLTFIRRCVFEQMPKPWFWSQPATDGSWELRPGKMDADTYFWVKLFDAVHKKGALGRRVVQANQTVIGHMELHVRWQVGGEIVVQTLKEYMENGPPYGMRNPTVDEVPKTHNPDLHSMLKGPDGEPIKEAEEQTRHPPDPKPLETKEPDNGQRPPVHSDAHGAGGPPDLQRPDPNAGRKKRSRRHVRKTS